MRNIHAEHITLHGALDQLNLRVFSAFQNEDLEWKMKWCFQGDAANHQNNLGQWTGFLI